MIKFEISLELRVNYGLWLYYICDCHMIMHLFKSLKLFVNDLEFIHIEKSKQKILVIHIIFKNPILKCISEECNYKCRINLSALRILRGKIVNMMSAESFWIISSYSDAHSMNQNLRLFHQLCSIHESHSLHLQH